MAGVRAGAKYSSLSMDPKERVHEDGQPCGGEKMLLMFDRWVRGEVELICGISRRWWVLACPVQHGVLGKVDQVTRADPCAS